MANIVQLKQDRAKAIADARAFLDAAEKENRQMTAEERDSYDKAFTKANELKEQIETEERQLELERQIEGEQRDTGAPETPETDQEKAFRSFLRTGEARGLTVGSDTQAGYLAPDKFIAQLLKELNNSVFIKGKATVHQLTNAKTLGIPYLDNDATDATWGAEVDPAPEDTTMDVGKREMSLNYMAKLIKVSRPLLASAAVDPEQLVRERFGYKFGVTGEKAYMSGDGSSKPLGLFVASADGISTGRDVAAASTTAIDADTLFKMKYNLKAQYRARAEWIFHRDVIEEVAKLKDSNNQYLWQPGLGNNVPDKLLGFAVNESEYAPNTMTTGQYVGLLGDLKYYWIAESLQFEMQRLNELYAATNQIGFIGRMQVDGAPVMEAAFARLKLA